MAQPPLTDKSTSTSIEAGLAGTDSRETQTEETRDELPSHRRNFFSLAAYQITMRIGWIFKTESIIMPAIMDLLCGPGTVLAAWLRSWLPQLNRIGQSIPQLLAADRIRNASQKKYTVVICSGLMGIIFLLLAGLWFFNSGQATPFMRVAYLVLYASFFICVGVNNLGFNTLQGKLIRYNFRGRLFLFANSVGGLSAIVAAWWLLSRWMDEGYLGITAIFLFAGVSFLISTLFILNCRESRDRPAKENDSVEGKATGNAASPATPSIWWLPVHLFRTNKAFRQLAIIAACFGISMVLFPHYQALYRATLEGTESVFQMSDLVTWVIIQNAGTVLISWAAGPAADRFGNRLVLQFVLFFIASAPLLAIFLSTNENLTRNYYFSVFLIVGVTPVTIRVLNNFALELAPKDSHPQFLSALSICIAFPVILCSQIVGWLIPILGFSTLFSGIAVIVGIGWFLTFFVSEPRSRLTNDLAQTDNL